MSILKKVLAIVIPVTAAGACYKLGQDHEYDTLSKGVFLYNNGKLDSTKESMRKIQDDMFLRGQELWLKDHSKHWK